MASFSYNKIVAVPSSGNKNPAAPKAEDKLNLSLAESSIQIGLGGFFKVLDSAGESLVRAENTAFTVAQAATFSSTLGAGASTLASAVVIGTLSAGASTLASAVVIGALSAGASTLASAVVSGTLSAGASTLDSATVTNNLTVTGNLTVNGTTTSLHTTDTTIKDNIIVLNDGEVAAGVTKGTSGISIVRGTLADAVILWDEPTDKFNLKVGTDFADLVINDLSAVGATLTGNLAAVDATLSGDLAAVDATLSGDLAAVDATLSGDLAAVGGTFSGNIAAVDATLSGDLAAVDATLSGNLAAVDGTFSGNIAAVDAALSGDIAAVDAAFSGEVHFTKTADTLSIAVGVVTETYALGVVGGAHFDGHARFARASGSLDLANAVTPDFMVSGKALYLAGQGNASNPDLRVLGYSKFHSGFAVAAEVAASIAITGVANDAISFSTITDGHIHLDSAKILKLSASIGIATNHTANAGAAVGPYLALSINAQGNFVAISAAAKNALVLGVSLASIANGASSKGQVAEFGKVMIAVADGVSIVAGDMLYLSANQAGKVTNEIPTGADSTAYMMGVALGDQNGGAVSMAMHRQFLYNN